MNERVLISVDEEGVASVRLNRAEKLNALDAEMFDALVAAQQKLCAWRGVRAVVLHGEGRAFCAGLDMKRMALMGQGETGRTHTLAERSHGVANKPQQVVWGWRDLPVPVIAAVHGVAFGGGLQIALGADMRCVAPDAKLSVMEIKWGLIPDMAGLALMRELLRGDVVRDLAYTGRIVSGQEAVALGLATWVNADPVEHARAVARQIARSNPEAIRAAKRILNASFDATAGEILLSESREQDRLMGKPNQMEAVRASFEGRAPAFKDPDVP